MGNPLGVPSRAIEVSKRTTAAAAVCTATMAASAKLWNVLAGFTVTGLGATAGSVIAVTVTGLLGGTRTFYYTVPAGVAVAAPLLQVEFDRPIPAATRNLAISVSAPSFGAGNTAAEVTLHGFATEATFPVG